MTPPTYPARTRQDHSAATYAADVPTQASLAEFYRSRSPELLYAAELNRKRLTLPHAAFECRAAATMRLLRSCPSGSLLDVGCGSGVILCRAAKLRRWARIVACDLSPGHLTFAEALCAEHGIRDVSFVVADAMNADPPIDRVDTVLCTEVLEHLEDPTALLRKLLIPATRNTRFIFSVPHAATSVMNLICYEFHPDSQGTSMQWRQYYHKEGSPSQLHTLAAVERIVHWDYSVSDFQSILQSCGYEIQRIHGAHYRGTVVNPLLHHLWAAPGLSPIARSILRDRVADPIWWRRPSLLPNIAPETLLFLCRAA
jgi:2-polyprenyl-3-methyl-5-hydroxy-6-metoxy-1,4-benzoquinol methylase